MGLPCFAAAMAGDLIARFLVSSVRERSGPLGVLPVTPEFPQVP